MGSLNADHLCAPSVGSVKGRSGRVLVLGSEPRMTLPVIRSLGRRGLQVHVAWCPRGNIALRSRYVRRLHPIPPFEAGDDAWLDALRSLLEKEPFDLVIPATEEVVFPMQQTRRAWENYPFVYLLSDRAFEVAFDKANTCRLAASIGIPVPRTVVLERSDQIDDLSAAVSAPAIVKPVCSVNIDDVEQKNYVRRLSSHEDLRAHIQHLLRKDAKVVVQEVVPGRGVGVEVLVHEGRILFSFQHQRIHETSGFGSTYRKSVPLEHHLVEAASRLLSEMDYTGVAMVEFRVDDATGRWVLLEINARFWGSLPLAVAAGADFPYYLYQMLVEGKRRFAREYRENVYCRQFLDDARWMWRTLTRKGGEGQAIGWAINRVSSRQLLADLARTLTFRDHIDTFAWDDPGPFAGELGQMLGLAARRFLPRSITDPSHRRSSGPT